MADVMVAVVVVEVREEGWRGITTGRVVDI